MVRSLDQIAADFDALSAHDFDLWNEAAAGMERLNKLTDELLELGMPEPAARLMFGFMERLDSSDLGSPGPLVHTLEKLPGYEALLSESVMRKPTPLTLWMVNRILNVTSDGGRRRQLVTLLRQAQSHRLGSDEARQEATGFLEYQGEA